MKLNSLIFLLFIFLISQQIFSQTPFVKNSDNVNPEDAYIIDNDIFVMENEVLLFEPGCILIFAKEKGLYVFGTLILRGTAKKKIVLKSKSGIWTGIDVGESGSVELNHVAINNGLNGLSVPDSQAISSINDVVFTSCYTNFKIGENSVHGIKNKIPFSFNVDSLFDSTSQLVVANKPKLIINKPPDNTPVKPNPFLERSTRSPLPKILIFTSSFLSAGSLVACLVSSNKAGYYEAKLDIEQETGFENLEKNHNKYFNLSKVSLITGLTTAAISAIFTLTINSSSGRF